MRYLRVEIMRTMPDTHGNPSGLAESGRHAIRLSVECEPSRGRLVAGIGREGL